MYATTWAVTAELALAAVTVPVLSPAAELRATGKGDAYALINGALAPNGNVVEVPDCGHAEFGPHITQVFDPALGGYAFRFHIHRDRDDDRCLRSDRQRNEIKVYDKSPERLKGKHGDVFEYRWKFRLDRSFQPSRRFTHLHQLKAVGGPEEDMPLVTLTARQGRSGEPDRFELNYAERLKQQTLLWMPLAPFLGRWAGVTERVSYGERGEFSVEVTILETGATVFSYENRSIRMWKSGAGFLRPKWGIYRSLQDRDRLKDEVVDFAEISIVNGSEGAR